MVETVDEKEVVEAMTMWRPNGALTSPVSSFASVHTAAVLIFSLPRSSVCFHLGSMSSALVCPSLLCLHSSRFRFPFLGGTSLSRPHRPVTHTQSHFICNCPSQINDTLGLTSPLVLLHLWNFPDSGYISPQGMITCLAAMTRIESFTLSSPF
jgi:hypothetical protein